MRKVACPNCRQQIYETEQVCPFCSHSRVLSGAEGLRSGSVEPVASVPTHTAPQKVAPLPQLPTQESEPPTNDVRELILRTPLWLMLIIVSLSGLVTILALLSITGEKEGPLAQLTKQGYSAVPVFMLRTVLRWLWQSFVMWIGLWIMATIAGAKFDLAFGEGYRMFLPVMMVAQLVGDGFLIASFMSGSPLFLLAFFVNIFVLKYFLDLDWTEIVLLQIVLALMSCATRGLM